MEEAGTILEQLVNNCCELAWKRGIQAAYNLCMVDIAVQIPKAPEKEKLVHDNIYILKDDKLILEYLKQLDKDRAIATFRQDIHNSIWRQFRMVCMAAGVKVEDALAEIKRRADQSLAPDLFLDHQGIPPQALDR